MAGQTPPKPKRRGRWVARDYPGLLWLITAVVVSFVHWRLPGSRWLMVHLVLLGALTHSVLVWSAHFAQALLKTDDALDTRRQQTWRIWLLFSGALCVFVGVPTTWWHLTLLGATAVTCAIAWHAVAMLRRLKAAIAGRFKITVRYYVVAAGFIPVGATLGVLLARGPDEQWHGRLLVAHTMTMVLGWVALTVAGTLITFWPTLLRTRIDDRAEKLASQALVPLVGCLLVVITGPLVGSRWLTVAGLVGYAGCMWWWGRALLAPLRRNPPKQFATWSVSSALIWFVVGLVWVTATVAGATDWGVVANSYGAPAAIFAAGFGFQLLTGALSFLVPMVLGGGPSVVRATGAWFDKWATLRWALVNAAVLSGILPLPAAVHVLTATLGLLAMASFIPFMILAIRSFIAHRRASAAVFSLAPPPARGVPLNPPALPAPEPPLSQVTSVWSVKQLVTALWVVAFAVAGGIAYDPQAAGLPGWGSSSSSVVASGQTTQVTVTATDMTFTPNTVKVPYGNRLVITLINDDPKSSHDIAFDNGSRSSRLAQGQQEELDVGVVGENMDGWCTVIGHRQMGMTFTVEVEGGPPNNLAKGHHGGAQSAATGANLLSPHLLHQKPSPEFRAVDAKVPPLPAATTHRLTFTIIEVELEVAPGIWQKRWTFNGTVPGPTLRGRIGDRFEITLVNQGSMGHSIDFHAGMVSPDQNMRTIAPGQSLLYTFVAERAGVWMYHCSTMPMSAHIAAGMTGAVIIDPPDLPPVAHSYLLSQSEVYLGTSHEKGSASDVDATKAGLGTADAVVFNGVANQYGYQPLQAKVGDRVRIWVLNQGPNHPLSFHVVGSQFDTVYLEGNWTLRPGVGGSQALGLLPAQGGFVEMTFREPGNYALVNHVMADAERGAHGFIKVTP